MKIIFMGTPDFAVPCLEGILKDPNHEVVGVFTQPDRRKGRGKKMQGTPVKILAQKENIPVYQPEKLNTEKAYEELKNIGADIFVVVAYGQILSKKILELPPYGAVNVHASLLPKYRGAAPIHWAVIHGEKETGITTMQMDEGLDTGDMLLQQSIPINEGETTGDLHDRLALLGKTLLLETLNKLEEKSIQPRPQGEDESSYAPKISKALGEIDWKASAREIHNLIRGLHPFPGAWTHYQGRILKLHEARWIKGDHARAPGTILEASREGILVATGRDLIQITTLQPSGKKSMGVGEFLAGNKIEVHEKLGAMDE